MNTNSHVKVLEQMRKHAAGWGETERTAAIDAAIAALKALDAEPDAQMANTIKPGDRIKDNDPRVNNRVLTVREVRGQNPNRTYAVCTDDFTKREYRIRIDRIHTDGKPRRSGFTLLEPSHG